ncbi:MAG: ABC transporter substrate-binding protein [Deltaproteobacteria bacterium RIFCSPLOWO2_12_FULL_40_28]|nr:MAG: ABC transporter substrate-binding protein [Deltaproteobacteria bacterium RIFCSPHIGHO2_02_FULL_40_28]OGQ19884.1 MAG: ABC transporter substrate-binding protein [Deltaproteobacteria bacterium RIFCSPHIGHO2_12_FULL_40_32]OGQ39643.1 MAG: ABC transporter substrate-binding protein [Deltaproteobacteria bacterium RIFCSPLOWO2_02_FULL_40_36]OGQ52899.1 MAG: ABC transporter substrate-binding protein [Deltaproteobacteria bacterium RIFCSPLOWO2_12_FULL_40_28]
MLIRIAHSPDSDDAFMFYALAAKKIDPEGLKFEHTLRDIETLNQAAHSGTYEITAVSIHAYAYLADRYTLLGSGASMGEGYGPMVVAKQAFPLSEFKNKKVAIPGRLTSAYLALQMAQPEFEPVVVPFDQILEVVEAGIVDAGLIIHEGQLQYQDMGFKLIVDLGQWWKDETGLPLPLGGNAVRKDLGMDLMKKLARLQKASIAYGLDHREDALNHAMQYARDLDPKQADRFVGMYVNQRTLDYGADGKKAVHLFLERAYQKKLIPHLPKIEFVD